MNGPAIMRALLLAHGPVATLVGTRVIAGAVPLATALPAIGIKEISRIEKNTASLGQPTVLVTARIQATVYARDYPEQKAVLQAAKLGPGAHTGVVAGVTVRSVIRDIVGPDMGDDAANTFEQSRDFKVTYLEQN